MPRIWRGRILDRSTIELCGGAVREGDLRGIAPAPPPPRRLQTSRGVVRPRDRRSPRGMCCSASGSSRSPRHHRRPRSLRPGAPSVDAWRPRSSRGRGRRGLRDLREATRYMRLCDVRLDLALGLLAIVELAPVGPSGTCRGSDRGPVDHRRPRGSRPRRAARRCAGSAGRTARPPSCTRRRDHVRTARPSPSTS